ncbi:glycoside hydrolase family 65 protein [Anaerobranca gottschalkii]|uniref:Hypothetical glycosyl hydrolase n=1 Tax=Anaerobranca gottschalkii DSM 13577 TaxID=1120990 RepID=A0A1H9YNU7_9FIRM|nr:glycosyl hydrolase family 65 protein [Anaerobranca gottschalkii]SES70807.1 hypothetical glycosyl hydrolase [Anaerobranca gottschalkii DSM 13577]
MKYDKEINGLKNWIVAEEDFCQEYLGKFESIMYQGNGYLGIRACTEETYPGEVRNTFISGTYNKFHPSEVTELPNAADVIGIDIYINGKKMNLMEGNFKNYSRYLNLKNGELVRNFIWLGPSGEEVEFTFKRLVSLANYHLVAQEVLIKPLSKPVQLKLKSGINGQMTNSGVQHFFEGEKRLYDGKYLNFIQTTIESNIHFVINSTHSFFKNNEYYEPESIILMDRRKIFFEFNDKIEVGQELVLNKLSTFHTSRDKELEKLSLKEIILESLKELREESKKRYNQLLMESEEKWEKEVWSQGPIEILSTDGFDQLAIRFAQYHLRIMTPFHDNRMSVGAKGLSGEGYKGHVFWDTEIFILPYYIYTYPDKARLLLEYRYFTLDGARKKAKENGYEGAMYPWESAWKDDGEVTPVWGAADIVTGEATKIWSGFIEQHISADISYAIWQYYQITGDEDFLIKYGYEMLFEIAKFWASRVEWNEEKGRYEIKGVIGPDEYKEHVDNNAFTNYMAKFAISIAIDCYNSLREKVDQKVFDELNEKIKIDDWIEKWIDVQRKIYLPKPNENLVIPQDDTYLQKEVIDLTKYKNQQQVGSIFRDYNLAQVNQIQVTKQADVIILLYLLEHYFSKDVKKANWDYYEPKTLHDSSLSLSTHCIIANDLGEKELAYQLFKKAAQIDLGPNMKSSDHGIHAASIGGIWQCVVNGFGGVRIIDGKLRIQPSLPENWSKLKFVIYYQGDKLSIEITKDKVMIEKLTNRNREIEILNNQQFYLLKDKLVLKI